MSRQRHLQSILARLSEHFVHEKSLFSLEEMFHCKHCFATITIKRESLKDKNLTGTYNVIIERLLQHADICFEKEIEGLAAACRKEIGKYKRRVPNVRVIKIG